MFGIWLTDPTHTKEKGKGCIPLGESKAENKRKKDMNDVGTYQWISVCVCVCEVVWFGKCVNILFVCCVGVICE